tara:strand:+ start:2916 stop:3068 length:153 start_codon:yes stop_codon:yes gene_type:complete
MLQEEGFPDIAGMTKIHIAGMTKIRLVVMTPDSADPKTEVLEFKCYGFSK